MTEVAAMSDDDLLLQINRFDPYDVEFARRFRALAAERDALRAALERIAEGRFSLAPAPDYVTNPTPSPQEIARTALNAKARAAIEPVPVSVREAARLTDGQLVARCADAWEQAPVGSTWEHRKGGVYVVKGVAVTSDDLTPVVVYQKATGYGPAFTRPAAEFLDGRFRAIAEGKE